MIAIPSCPILISNHMEYFNTKYIMITLSRLANTIAIQSYSSLRIKSMEKVPGPTIKGKANGTTEAVRASGSILKMEIFKHISKPSSKMMILPAKIKEALLIANSCRIKDPPSKKASIKIMTTIDIFKGSIVLPFLRILTTMARLPGVFSVANKIQQQEKNC